MIKINQVKVIKSLVWVIQTKQTRDGFRVSQVFRDD